MLLIKCDLSVESFALMRHLVGSIDSGIAKIICPFLKKLHYKKEILHFKMSVRNIFIQLFKICRWPVLDLRTDSEISPPSEWHLFLTFLEFLSPLEILPFLLNEMGWEV